MTNQYYFTYKFNEVVDLYGMENGSLSVCYLISHTCTDSKKDGYQFFVRIKKEWCMKQGTIEEGNVVSTNEKTTYPHLGGGSSHVQCQAVRATSETSMEHTYIL